MFPQYFQHDIIETEQVSPQNWFAYVPGSNRSLWGMGETEQEAIGQLWLNHSHLIKSYIIAIYKKQEADLYD